MKRQIATSSILYPNPVALVTCSYGNKDNIITIAWLGTICSEPPMISISIRPSRFSHELVKQSKEFVINIPDEKMVNACDFCGTASGRDVDKFEALNFHKQKAFVINTPLIEECPVSIECKVKQILSLGTHDMFIAEVLNVSSDENKLAEKRTGGKHKWMLGWQTGVYYQCHKI
jgi:flavin reductase (DIM6/NTAB) family NADH-FMN oxidoreductase RutF